MRAAFLTLLMLNLALYGWLHGLFGNYPASGREASRLDQQIAAERIRVLTEGEVQQLEKRAGEAKANAAATAAAASEAPASCTQIGDFVSDAQLARLRQRLTEMKLADRASEQSRDLPGWYRVYLPPARSLADAEQRAAQLRSQGVRDLLVLQDDRDLRFAIVLGSFRDRDLARKQAALLERRGMKEVRVSQEPTTVRTTRVVIRGADAAAAQLAQLQKDFPQEKVEPCSPDASP